jgi:hypothetical protein
VKLRAAVTLLCLAFVTSACSIRDDVSRDAANTVTEAAAIEPKEVAPDAWKAVLNDWFDDGRVDGRHSCAAVREAIRQLPEEGIYYSNPADALGVAEARVCG